jgi:hypothetical protein
MQAGVPFVYRGYKNIDYLKPKMIEPDSTTQHHLRASEAHDLFSFFTTSIALFFVYYHYCRALLDKPLSTLRLDALIKTIKN